MSMYSGKCDCADSFWMCCNSEEDVQREIDRTDFYIYGKNDRKFKLDIHSVKDLAPYYPFLISTGVWGREGRNTVVFSSESFVDTEEREHMQWELRDALAEYKRCKRKKIPFDPDAYYENTHWRHNYSREIVDRVARDGLKANLDDLHSDTFDKWDRTTLAQELSRLGYDDWFINHWVFGWRKEYPNWKEEEEA